MTSRKMLFGVLSASAVAALAPTAATAGSADSGLDNAMPMAVDAFGRVTLASQDIGDLLGSAGADVREMYAGNNCTCVNRGCGREAQMA